MYELVVKAGVHKASIIKVAEAAKIIENTQRDLNIALMNELSIIFDKMNINTFEVLEAAGTKWNFLKFQPGLLAVIALVLIRIILLINLRNLVMIHR